MKLATLREALDASEPSGEKWVVTQPVLNAAQAVVAGQEVRWCSQHESIVDGTVCQARQAVSPPPAQSCPVALRYVVDY